MLIWLHLFVLAAGCADSMRLTCRVQHVPQEQGGGVLAKQFVIQNRGSLKVSLPTKHVLPTALLLVCQVTLKEGERHEVAKNMSRKLFTCKYVWVWTDRS